MSDVIATFELFQRLHTLLVKAGICRVEDILSFESLPRFKCDQLLID